MNKRTLTVYELAKALNLEILGCRELAKKITIRHYGVNRPSFEFLGYKTPTSNRLGFVSDKEINFLETLKTMQEKEKAINFSLNEMPAVVIAHIPKSNKDFKLFVKLAKIANVPILYSHKKSFEEIYHIFRYTIKNIIPSQTVVGTMMNIYNKGVWIKGKSGIGKSEIALALLQKSHFFVADDSINLSTDGIAVIAKAESKISEHLEVRGIGIIDIKKMFGYHCFLEESPLDLIINLVDPSKLHEVERIGEKYNMTEFFGIQVPEISIPIYPGRSVAPVIETAVIYLQLHKSGNSPLKELNKELTKLIKQNADD